MSWDWMTNQEFIPGEDDFSLSHQFVVFYLGVEPCEIFPIQLISVGVLFQILFCQPYY